MPCRDWEYEDTYYASAHDAARSLNRELEARAKQLEMLRNHCDKLAQMLCSACRNLEAVDSTFPDASRGYGTLDQWWRAHKIKDAARRADQEAEERQAELARREAEEEQMIMDQALNKLTDREKEVLGLG